MEMDGQNNSEAGLGPNGLWYQWTNDDDELK